MNLVKKIATIICACAFVQLVMAQPANDNWANRIDIPLASLTAGFINTQTDIANATTEASDPSMVCKGGDPAQRGNTVWYSLTTGASVIYLKLTTGTSYDNAIAMFVGDPTSGFINIVGGCNDDGAGSGSLSATIDGLRLTPNTTYNIVIAKPAQNTDPATLVFNASLATVRTVSKIFDTNDGVCDSDCSLREAINAGSGAIDMPAGDYRLSIAPSGSNNDGASGDLDVSNRNIYIYGASTNSTVIRPDMSFTDRMIDLDPFGTQFGGTFMLSDLTVRGGNSGFGPGGCIQVPNAGFAGTPNEYLVLDNVTVSGCTTQISGGGISNPGAPMLIRQSTIRDNTSGSGGGGIKYGQLGSNVNVQGVILQSTINGNTSNSNFSNGGGGIETHGNLLLLSSTVANNRARQSGGGVLVTTSSGRILVNSSTIANNTANYDNDMSGANGGGIRFEVASSSAYSMSNTVLADNLLGTTAQDCHAISGALIQGHGNWVQANATCNFVEASQTLNQPALLDTLANNGGPTQTIALLSNSPLIDATNASAFCPGFDQRGFARPIDGDNNLTATCDIGALEMATVPPDLLFQNGFE